MTSYISFCQNLCIFKNTLIVFGNDKALFIRNLIIKLRRGKKLSRAARKPNTMSNERYGQRKTDYRRKLEGQFLSYDTRGVWQGLQCITGCKQKSSTPGFDSATPDNFNKFRSSEFDANRACKSRARKRGWGQLGAGGPYTPC